MVEIGTQFAQHSGKRTDIYTVIDIFTTFNSKGTLVKKEYLCNHEFCGQLINTIEPLATIHRSLLKSGV